MKKYLFICISTLTIILIYSLLEIYTGFYISLDLRKSEPNYIFYADEDNVYIKDDDGTAKKILIKGIELTSAYPGYNFSDYKVDEDTYLNWLEQIKEMGANTIKLTSRMNPEFYSA